MSIIAWNRYPLVSQNTHAKNWLQLQTNLASNTIDAYGRALNGTPYLIFEVIAALKVSSSLSV